jgi:hypothetical protein
MGTKAGWMQTPPHLSLLVSPRMMYSNVCLSMSAAMLYAGSVAAQQQDVNTLYWALKVHKR